MHAYHFCDKCDSLQGGIYEKGPFERFAGPNKDNCEHEWQEITRECFKQLATDKYNVDWDQETAHFWIHDNKPDAAHETHVPIEDAVKD